MGPSWISVLNDFSFFYLQVTLMFPIIGLLVQEKKQRTDFQDGTILDFQWGHLGFLFGTI